MLHFQRIVATRNDLGALASMHNKFVRLALVRLRLSIKEYLGELPPETEALLEQVTRPDPDAPLRLVVPTCPTLLATGEKVRLLVVAPGPGEVSGFGLRTRSRRSREWTTAPARLLGRRTYEVTLGPFAAESGLVDYYVFANGGKLVAPPEAPQHTYTLTVL